MRFDGTMLWAGDPSHARTRQHTPLSLRRPPRSATCRAPPGKPLAGGLRPGSIPDLAWPALSPRPPPARSVPAAGSGPRNATARVTGPLARPIVSDSALGKGPQWRRTVAVAESPGRSGARRRANFTANGPSGASDETMGRKTQHSVGTRRVTAALPSALSAQQGSIAKFHLRSLSMLTSQQWGQRARASTFLRASACRVRAQKRKAAAKIFRAARVGQPHFRGELHGRNGSGRAVHRAKAALCELSSCSLRWSLSSSSSPSSPGRSIRRAARSHLTTCGHRDREKRRVSVGSAP